MSMDTAGPPFGAHPARGPVDPRVADAFLNGGWASLGAALAGFLVHFAANLYGVADLADATVLGLRLAAIGLALGPVFAAVTRRVPVPLLPAGLVLGTILVPIARAWTVGHAAPLLVYGATLGLLLRQLRGPAPGS